jgi:hypothetical protein
MNGHSSVVSGFSRTRAIRFVLAAIVAALTAIALLMSRQPACEPGGPAVKGQVRRDSTGKLQYFDGRCWSRKPLPPRDQPF